MLVAVHDTWVLTGAAPGLNLVAAMQVLGSRRLVVVGSGVALDGDGHDGAVGDLGAGGWLDVHDGSHVGPVRTCRGSPAHWGSTLSN